MFVVINFWRNACIKPHQLGVDLEKDIDTLIKTEIEGKKVQPHGFVVCVIRILQQEKGRIQDGSSNVIIPVKVQAVVFEEIKGEVIDATITAVNPMGFFAQCGPVKVFVAKSNLPSDFKFEDGEWRAEMDVLSVNINVRVRVIGYKSKFNELTAVARMDQDFLGLGFN